MHKVVRRLWPGSGPGSMTQSYYPFTTMFPSIVSSNVRCMAHQPEFQPIRSALLEARSIYGHCTCTKGVMSRQSHQK